MTDKYADLRAALEAGPTPGPWEVDEHYVQQQGRPEIGICDVLNMDEGGPKGWYRGPKTAANLALIAAAHPETIRALLAERDALRGALEGAWTLIAQLPPTQDRVEIAQMVCAALAQEQGEPHDNQD